MMHEAHTHLDLIHRSMFLHKRNTNFFSSDKNPGIINFFLEKIPSAHVKHYSMMTSSRNPFVYKYKPRFE